MKCKAERPWLLFANLWGPFFSLPLLMFLSFIGVSPSQRDAFLPRYHSPPPSTSHSSPLCLGDNDLPLLLFFFFAPARAELCTFLMFGSKVLIQTGIVSWETPVAMEHVRLLQSWLPFSCVRVDFRFYAEWTHWPPLSWIKTLDLSLRSATESPPPQELQKVGLSTLNSSQGVRHQQQKLRLH